MFNTKEMIVNYVMSAWWNYTVFKDKTRDEKTTYEITSNEKVEYRLIFMYIW